METISREELKAALDEGADIKLVMTLGDFGFQAKHIPGSMQLKSFKEAKEMFDPADEIVVYCSDEDCGASQMAYHTLKRSGYENVRRYSGGIADWEDAGLPLEGELA
ncbi:MAG: rhodanese-like domain-containing protein [Solirubrobacterales bacterium]